MQSPNQTNDSLALSAQPAEVQQAMNAIKMVSRSSGVVDRGGLLDPTVLQIIAALMNAINNFATKREVPANGAARGDMQKTYEFGPGHVDYFPTWSFWGRTFVRMENIGSVPTTVMINEDRFQLEPGQATTKDGQWAAFPIRVANTNESIGSMVRIRVW